jgi:hypothetical protein
VRVHEGAHKVLQTANGEVDASNEADVFMHQMGLNTKAIVFDETPSVLSLGRLCTEQGCGFQWAGDSIPYLLLPNGTRIDLDVADNAPQLKASTLFDLQTRPRVSPAVEKPPNGGDEEDNTEEIVAAPAASSSGDGPPPPDPDAEDHSAA